MATDSKSRILSSGQDSPQTATKKSKKKRKREKENDGLVADVQHDQPVNGDICKEASVNVKIEVTYDQTNKTPPIVGYFPSGYNPHKNINGNNLPESDQEAPAASLPPSVTLYRNTQRVKVEKVSNEKNDKWKGSERLELVVSPNESNVEFVGKSYKGEAMSAQLCTYALGVLDKETQTLKIMPIAGNKIFRLEPRVRGSQTADKEPSAVENVELSGEQKAERRRELTMRYGSKKSVAQDKKLQALNRGDDPDSQKILDIQLNNAPVNKDALESTSAHVARNIPPHNTSATTPQDAYPLDRIILSGEWDFLEDIFELLRVKAEVPSNAYPTFVCNRIHKLREIKDETEKKKLAHIMSYITHLIKFKDLHSVDGASSAKNHKFPSIVRQRFVGMFNPEARRLPVEKIDLLISYILVLTLYADDFRTNPADIAKDLRMSPVILRAHFENLGCKLVRKDKLLLATLPAPLTFPILRQRRRR